MNTAYRTLFAGMLSLVFCGTAVAHDWHHDDWSGGISIAVTPGGEVVWQGGLNYHPATVQPVRYIAVPRGYRVPMCHHPSHRHPVMVRKGHKHGRKHRVIHVYH